MVGVLMADEDFRHVVQWHTECVKGGKGAGPQVKDKLSPLPSSIRKHAAACFTRGIGMPEPQAMTRISSAASSSVPESRPRDSGKV